MLMLNGILIKGITQGYRWKQINTTFSRSNAQWFSGADKMAAEQNLKKKPADIPFKEDLLNDVIFDPLSLT
jgi:hypothetical protein